MGNLSPNMNSETAIASVSTSVCSSGTLHLAIWVYDHNTMAELSDVRYTAIPHLSKCKHRVLQALCLPFSGVFHRKTWLGALSCVVFISSQSTPPGDGTGLSCDPAPTADVQHFHKQTDAYCKDQDTWDMRETLHSKSALSSACHEHTSLPTPGLRHP